MTTIENPSLSIPEPPFPGEFFSKPDIATIEQIKNYLESKELAQLISEGKITLALIKPDLKNAVLNIENVKDDAEIITKIKSEIQRPLQEIFSLSFSLTDEMVEAWYAGAPKQSQISIPPIDENRYGLHHKTRWDEFKSLMLHDPVTFILFYAEDGEAIENWRQQMGNHWNVAKVKEAFPNSLRAKYAKDNHNNLLHGSDSKESVSREIKLFAEFLEILIHKK